MKIEMLKFCVWFFISFTSIGGAKLLCVCGEQTLIKSNGITASYIKACSLSDPNLNECALKHGRDALSSLIKGDNKYKIPNMVPLRIPEIKFGSGDLNVKLNDVVITGFDNAQIKDINIDVKKQHVAVTIIIDRANLLSSYSISGRISVLPIQGEGAANITFIGGEYFYQFDYDIKEKKGEPYLDIVHTKLDYTTKKSHFGFENLFGGDEVLANQIELFLDENWKEVEQDIGPALTQTIDLIITAALNGIFNIVPFNQVFLP